MEFVTAGLGPVASVAQLAGNVGTLIFKIKRAVDKAKQNERECAHLVVYLSMIQEVLPTLPEDTELAGTLDKLRSTLEEAHELVVSCEKRGSFNKFLRAGYIDDRFKEVNARISAFLALVPLVIYAAMARRLDQIMILAQHDSGTVAYARASSSGSVAVQTHQKVVSEVSSVSDDQPREFTWAEIKAATENLAVVLGGGRSGTVYKGRIHHGGRVREVAVKVLKNDGRLGMEDAFVAELEILFPLYHDHVALLLGWCAEDERRMFVYEHMSNGTLRDHLLGVRGGGGSPVASSWKARLEVLLGASRAIQHLHRHATPPVIHRNVSSSNILLDAGWTSRLSDFGQALWQEAGGLGGQGQLVPEAIGTLGYLDPEYESTRYVSPASDVYSFGVVTLEVLTGRPPVSSSSWGKLAEVPVTLLSSVLPVIQKGNLRDVLDGRPSLLPTARQLEALELVGYTAALCLCPLGNKRPAMSNVVANLETALGIIRSDEVNQLLCY